MKKLTLYLILFGLILIRFNAMGQNKISLQADHIILGSEDIPPAGNIQYDDTLMFFDQTKYALRFGRSFQQNLWQPDSIGVGSFAWGINTVAAGNYAYSGGENNSAKGNHSFTHGFSNSVNGQFSTALGQFNKSHGTYSFAQGLRSEALADHSIVMGERSVVQSEKGVSIGDFNEVTGIKAIALGSYLKGRSYGSLNIGQYNVPFGTSNTWGSGDLVFIIGNGESENSRSNALSVYKNGSFVLNRHVLPEEGALVTEKMLFFNTSNGSFRSGILNNSDAWQTSNLGNASASFGFNSIASGAYSFSAGKDSEATGSYSQSFGSGSRASGNLSFASGFNNDSRGSYSFSFGRLNNADSDYSTVIGQLSTALGIGSISIGSENFVTGDQSMTVGTGVDIRASHTFALGRYNVRTPNNPSDWDSNDALFILGNGNTDTDRSNAFTVLKNGSLILNYHQLPNITQTYDDPVLFFDTEQYAFRAGRVIGTQWSQSNIGAGSFAVGVNTIAKGINSIATGFQTSAQGLSSSAFGQMTLAFNDYSTAMGFETSAQGVGSFAAGMNTRALSYGSFVVGRWNVSPLTENRENWEGSESLFVIGNGSGDNSRNNALTVLQNGHTGLGTAAPESILDVRGGALVKMNSSGTNSQLTLEETADDFARLDFKNTATTDRWTIAARPQAVAADARFNVFLENVGNLVTVTGDERLGIARTPTHPLHVGTDATNGNGAHVTAGGTWTNGSSRTFKENFQPINTAEILSILSGLEIQKWEYKGADEGLHMGPIAEEFYEAFGLGNNEKYISTVDIDGVALAAIQALARENEELKQRLEKLENIISKMENR